MQPGLAQILPQRLCGDTAEWSAAVQQLHLDRAVRIGGVAHPAHQRAVIDAVDIAFIRVGGFQPDQGGEFGRCPHRQRGAQEVAGDVMQAKLERVTHNRRGGQPGDEAGNAGTDQGTHAHIFELVGNGLGDQLAARHQPDLDRRFRRGAIPGPADNTIRFDADQSAVDRVRQHHARWRPLGFGLGRGGLPGGLSGHELHARSVHDPARSWLSPDRRARHRVMGAHPDSTVRQLKPPVVS